MNGKPKKVSKLVSGAQNGQKTGQRNEVVDAFRGLAAVWVAVYHFSGGAGVGTFGYLSVTIFFVISGYIVPYSMMQSGYVIAAWPRFMLKRLVRLEPPYLASLVFLLAIGVWDTFFGVPPTWTAVQILGHLGYINAFLGLPWLNSAYWTLAVEFQFYILMGLVLPLLRLGNSLTRLVGLALVACLPLLSLSRSNATIFPLLPVFAIGCLSFLVASRLIGWRSYWVALGVFSAIIFKKHDADVALVTTGTAVLVATVHIPRIAPFAWLGKMSYSLYLLHIPIGLGVISLIIRISGNGVIGIPSIATGLAASLAAAALLNRYVEQPSLRLAARIGYGRERAISPNLATPNSAAPIETS